MKGRGDVRKLAAAAMAEKVPRIAPRACGWDMYSEVSQVRGVNFAYPL